MPEALNAPASARLVEGRVLAVAHLSRLFYLPYLVVAMGQTYVIQVYEAEIAGPQLLSIC